MNKKYVLKPGRHQFAPGSPASHTNDNLTDEEAKWYIKKYPHIISLFDIKEDAPKQGTVTKSNPPANDDHYELVISTMADEAATNNQ